MDAIHPPEKVTHLIRSRKPFEEPSCKFPLFPIGTQLHTTRKEKLGTSNFSPLPYRYSVGNCQRPRLCLAVQRAFSAHVNESLSAENESKTVQFSESR